MEQSKKVQFNEYINKKEYVVNIENKRRKEEEDIKEEELVSPSDTWIDANHDTKYIYNSDNESQENDNSDEYDTIEASYVEGANIKENNINKTQIDYETIRREKMLKLQYGISLDDDENIDDNDESIDSNEINTNVKDIKSQLDVLSSIPDDNKDITQHIAKAIFDEQSKIKRPINTLRRKYENNIKDTSDDELNEYRKRAHELLDRDDNERIESHYVPMYNTKLQTFRERGAINKEQMKEDMWYNDLEQEYEIKNLQEINIDSDQDDEYDEHGTKIERRKRIDPIAIKMKNIAEKDRILYNNLSSRESIPVNRTESLQTLLQYIQEKETIQDMVLRLSKQKNLIHNAPIYTVFQGTPQEEQVSLQTLQRILKRKNLRKSDRLIMERQLNGTSNENSTTDSVGISDEEIDKVHQAIDSIVSTGDFSCIYYKSDDL